MEKRTKEEEGEKISNDNLLCVCKSSVVADPNGNGLMIKKVKSSISSAALCFKPPNFEFSLGVMSEMYFSISFRLV